jgi:hypothetical protein
MQPRPFKDVMMPRNKIAVSSPSRVAGRKAAGGGLRALTSLPIPSPTDVVGLYLGARSGDHYPGINLTTIPQIAANGRSAMQTTSAWRSCNLTSLRACRRVAAQDVPKSLQLWAHARAHLVASRLLQRNSLHGFASIRLGAALKINDVAIHRHENGKCWMLLPSKRFDADGWALVDDGGKQRYAPILEWTDKSVADRFSAVVVAVVRNEHGPEAPEQPA